jgi:hypothetical protein
MIGPWREASARPAGMAGPSRRAEAGGRGAAVPAPGPVERVDAAAHPRCGGAAWRPGQRNACRSLFLICTGVKYRANHLFAQI